MALDGTTIVEQTIGFYNPDSAADVAAVNTYKNKLTIRVPVAATTILATSLTAMASIPAKYQAVAARIITPAAVTAGTTDYFTVAIEKNDGAGGTNTVVASALATTTGTGSWTAKSTIPMVVVTTAASTIAATNDLWVNVTKTGSTGLVSPAIEVEIDLLPTA